MNAEQYDEKIRQGERAKERQEAIDDKCKGLCEFFAPEFVGWAPPSGTQPPVKEGEQVTAIPFAGVQAVRDRLDAVLGADNWRESYDNPGTPESLYTRCVLAVRFEAGGDWVTRVGLSNSKELTRAHAEALRDAARSLGVGRYLQYYPQSVPWNGTGYASSPRLPDCALPPEYRRVSRDIAFKVRQLVCQAADESTKRARPVTKLRAAELFAKWQGYGANDKGEVDFSRMQVRHCAAIADRATQWIGELAQGNTIGAACPLTQEEKEKVPFEEKKTQNPDSRQNASPLGDSRAPAGGSEKTSPINSQPT